MNSLIIYNEKLFSASDDSTIKVWDLNEEKLLGNFIANTTVTEIDVSDDGEILCAGDLSGNIYFLAIENIDMGVAIVEPFKDGKIFKVRCSYCSQDFNVYIDGIGNIIKCPFCGSELKLKITKRV